MNEKHKHSSATISDFKNIISDFISSKFKEIVKSDREKLSDIISLFMSEKTISNDTFNKLKSFYQKDEVNRNIFFNILSNFTYENAEFLFNQIYAVTDNPLWLIQLADDLDEIISKVSNQDVIENGASIRKMRGYFRSYFSKIYNLHYLITFEYNANNTPINLLKYIARKDGIHPASHWSVFEERLNIPEHILLGLEHFKTTSQPIVYVEIAFSKGLIKSIHNIIGENKIQVDVKNADTAIFYSLNSTLKALSGIGLGEKMLIRAKEYIKNHYPHIKQFSTLSPVPGLRKYLDTIIQNQKASFSLSKDMLDDTSKNNIFFSHKNINMIMKEYKRMNSNKNYPFSKILMRILHSNNWFETPVYKKNLEDPLLKLTKYYLTVEKKKDLETGRMLDEALDPVAHFHLSNGACIGSINFLANTTEKGLSESFGIMVNYIYSDKKLDSNKIKYSQGILDSQV